MRYRLINRVPQIGKSLMKVVMDNRNINNLPELLNVSPNYQLPGSALNNMGLAVDTIITSLKGNEVIGILVDSDVDGFTSAALIYRYITCLKPDANIKLFFHSGKQHGLSEDVFMDIRSAMLDLLIITDAGTNDYKEHETLYNDGVKIVVIDHHEAEEESKSAIIVNNQLSNDYANKSLSGVGMTYKVCENIDSKLGFNVAPYFLDLVALGNIADGMNLKALETRYLVQQGMKYINNTLIKAIIEKQAHPMGNKVNITTVGWNVAPMLNAVIRCGSMEDKMNMFKGFITDDMDFCREVVNKCLSVQRKQNATVKKAIPIIERKIEELNPSANRFIMVDVTGIIDNELVGLVANKLMNTYKKPIFLLHERENIEDELTGSVRCPKEVDNFKRICLGTGEFIFCEGHGNAFGCSIKKGNEEVAAKLNKALEQYGDTIERTHEVDAVIDLPYLNREDILAIGSLADLWGNGIDEPIFVIKGIKVLNHDIALIGKNNTIKFQTKGIDCLKFFTNKEEHRKMCLLEDEMDISTHHLLMDIVCKFKVNEWNGNVKPQLEILDYEVKKDALYFF